MAAPSKRYVHNGINAGSNPAILTIFILYKLKSTPQG